MNTLPIGILDSGIGGLTVVHEITQLLPCEDILYFADTAHFPYGEKSPDEILRYTFESASFLLGKQIKLLLLACHTASCHALAALSSTLPIPVLGLCDPSLATLQSLPSRVALLATPSTVQSGLYDLPHVLPIACPLLASLIEQNLPAETTARHDLAPILEQKISTVFLACTHYPLILPLLQTLLGPDTRIIDPALPFAHLVQRTLFSLNLLNTPHPPRIEFFTSGPIQFLQKLEEKIEIVKYSNSQPERF